MKEQDQAINQKLPFLEAVCWQTENVYAFAPQEMLSRYERGWRYKDLFVVMEQTEIDFVRHLAAQYHSWLITEL